jgi:hypothetical protein
MRTTDAVLVAVLAFGIGGLLATYVSQGYYHAELARRPYRVVERHGSVVAVEDDRGRMFFVESDGTLTPFAAPVVP